MTHRALQTPEERLEPHPDDLAAAALGREQYKNIDGDHLHKMAELARAAGARVTKIEQTCKAFIEAIDEARAMAGASNDGPSPPASSSLDAVEDSALGMLISVAEAVHPSVVPQFQHPPSPLGSAYLRLLRGKGLYCTGCEQSLHFHLLPANFGATLLAIGFCPHGCKKRTYYQKSMLVSDLAAILEASS